jgi:DNA repair exonuclease SbcCD ATPase subunit
MPNHNFNQHPGNSVPTNRNPQNPESIHPTDYHESEQQRLDRLSQEVQELKLASQSNARNHHRQVNHLRRRFGMSTGIFVVVIAVLGGTIAWLGSSLNAERAERSQLAEQIRSANEGRQAGIERITDLQSQISALREQARSLSQQAPETITRELREIQDKLRDLETQIREMATNAEARRQVVDTLERSLNLNNQEKSPSPENPDSNSN